VNGPLPFLPAQPYRPATFQERGVAVPFTTPILAGVRVRHGQRNEIELVIPNPSGGHGVYIMSCGSLRSLCRLTVHDSRLNQRIAELPRVAPATVRQAVLDVAAQGLAGRPAMEAAIAAVEKDRQVRAVTHFLLLGALAGQVAPKEFGGTNWRSHPSPEIEQQARRSIAQAASKVGLSTARIFAAIEALAEEFSGIGVAGQPEPGRVLRQIGHLAALREQLADWMLEHCDDTHIELADTVAEAARQVIAAADPMLVAANGMTQDMVSLVHTWIRSPQRVRETASRAEWLLDGWEQICRMWQASEDPDQQWATMSEMVQLLPVQPREIADWSAAGAPLAERPHQAMRFDAVRRTETAALNLTARNERLRTFTV
jgi:hypothetical protein